METGAGGTLQSGVLEAGEQRSMATRKKKKRGTEKEASQFPGLSFLWLHNPHFVAPYPRAQLRFGETPDVRTCACSIAQEMHLVWSSSTAPHHSMSGCKVTTVNLPTNLTAVIDIAGLYPRMWRVRIVW